MEKLLRYLADKTGRALAYLVGGIFLVSTAIYLPCLLYGASPLSLFNINNLIRRLGTPWPYSEIMSRFGIVSNPDTWQWMAIIWATFSNSLHGYYGISLLYQKPVSDLLAQRLPNTLLLMLSSAIIALIIVQRYVRKFEKASHHGKGRFTALENVPVFWVGMVSLMLFSFSSRDWSLRIFGVEIGFPEFGTISYDVWVIARESPFGAIMLLVDVLFHLILPSLILGLFIAAYIWNTVRAGMNADEEIRPTLFSLLGIAGDALAKRVPAIIGSLILIEVIFNWNGIGKLFFTMLLLLDYPSLLGCLVSFVILAVGTTWVVHIVGGIIEYASESDYGAAQSSPSCAEMKTAIRAYLIDKTPEHLDVTRSYLIRKSASTR